MGKGKRRNESEKSTREVFQGRGESSVLGEVHEVDQFVEDLGVSLGGEGVVF